MNACATKTDYTNYHPNTQHIAQHVHHYKKLASQEWPALQSHTMIKPGKQSDVVEHIRTRLTMLGDLKATHVSRQYDEDLKRAVIKFQSRHGLKTDGIIGKSTLSALNISPKLRLNQLQKSLKQWMKLPLSSELPYIQVNLPSYNLVIIKDNQTKLQMKVITGAKDWPTPILNSAIQSIVINPKWTIPQNIVEKEMVHKIAEDPEYLSTQKIHIYEGWQPDSIPIDPLNIDWQQYVGKKRVPYRLQQTAGSHNALGQVKFTFPNEQHIYLHDTPNKQAFNLSKRNLSHGCIRLEKAQDLLNYLLDQQIIKNTKKIKQYTGSQETKHLALNKKLPLYITNISVWVDKAGVLQFR